MKARIHSARRCPIRKPLLSLSLSLSLFLSLVLLLVLTLLAGQGQGRRAANKFQFSGSVRICDLRDLANLVLCVFAPRCCPKRQDWMCIFFFCAICGAACAHCCALQALPTLCARTMIRRSFSRAAVALNGTTINPNVKEAKVGVYVIPRKKGSVMLLCCLQPEHASERSRRHVLLAGLAGESYAPAEGL